MTLRRYQQHDADNARWEGFEFRPGDVVIVAPSKSGTTWTQLLVALLVFDGPDFPEPVGKLSPWMDHTTQPAAEVHRALGAQDHRRFIKSHTPLDGLPVRDEVLYVCVGRDPRDAFVSMEHHLANLDRARLRELSGATEPPPAPPREGDPVDRFIDGPGGAGAWNLAWLADFYATFWERRHQPNVELFHYAAYERDLREELARLAAFLGIPLDGADAERLAAEASIDRARRRASDIAPEAHLGVFKDPVAFFRSGTSGGYRKRFTAAQLARYERRIYELAPPDLAGWMHDGSAPPPG